LTIKKVALGREGKEEVESL